jgi:purine nucleoside phosphorylase
MRGRYHVYEGADGPAISTPIRALKLLGTEALVLTNAAGSLRAETPRAASWPSAITSTCSASTR